jgi:large subunit ribosomal protein L53
MLRHLKRVFIQFSPLDPRATSARELLQRVGCDAARKSNPACAVDFSVDEAGGAGSAFVELQFVDDAQQRLPTADLRVDDIVRLIDQKASEMELRAVMKEVGFDPAAQAAAAAAQGSKGAAASGGKR